MEMNKYKLNIQVNKQEKFVIFMTSQKSIPELLILVIMI